MKRSNGAAIVACIRVIQSDQLFPSPGEEDVQSAMEEIAKGAEKTGTDPTIFAMMQLGLLCKKFADKLGLGVLFDGGEEDEEREETETDGQGDSHPA